MNTCTRCGGTGYGRRDHRTNETRLCQECKGIGFQQVVGSIAAGLKKGIMDTRIINKMLSDAKDLTIIQWDYDWGPIPDDLDVFALANAIELEGDVIEEDVDLFLNGFREKLREYGDGLIVMPLSCLTEDLPDGKIGLRGSMQIVIKPL